MIVINTLKVARAMSDAGMPVKQAEALAEALNDGMKDNVVTKEFLSAELAQLSSHLTNKIYGMAIGIITATGLIQYFVK